MENNGRQHGHLKWFDPVIGYGFIIPMQGGRDIFCHRDNSEAGQLAKLEKDQAVTFVVVPTRKGPKAFDVQLDVNQSG